MVQSFVSEFGKTGVIADFILPMVIAIFAFAFPLLLQVASRIDDKYKSTLLVKVFRKDPYINYFLCGLVFTKVCIFFYYGLLMSEDLLFTLITISLVVAFLFLDNRKLFVPIYCFAFVCDLSLLFISIFSKECVRYSALILLLISTFLLVFSIFYVIWLVYVYYVPEKLLERLKEHYYKTSADDDKEQMYRAISSILFYSISKEDEPLARELQDFYWTEFISYRKGKENKSVVYPSYFYDVMYAANERLCLRRQKNISWYNGSICDFFIDEYQYTIISDETYNIMWKCITQSIFYDKDKFIISYWRKAHQYMTFRLGTISPKYDNNDKVTNQSVIDGRNAEREKFLEFHYALGGLLMMKQKYALIKSIISWTNQMPPKYILIPETMGKVIMKFMEVERRKGADFLYYAQRYPFPDISGVYANDSIKMWIKRYIAILFLLQYTLPDPYYCSRLKMPNPPQTLSEMKSWIDELDILKIIVEEYLSDKACLKSLNLEVLSSPEWFETNKKESPEKWIESLKNELKETIEQEKENQELDPEKINQLNTETKKILTECFDYYEQIFKNNVADTEPHNSVPYGGIYKISDKMEFAIDQDISYANFDSIYAEIITTEFNYNLPSIFSYYKTSCHKLVKNDIFSAINNLQLDSLHFTIVSVGVNLFSYMSIGVTHIENRLWEYKGIPIIELLGCHQIDDVNNSLFIMRNEDLPCVLHDKVDEQSIVKYELIEIDEKYHVYTNVIDLHKNTAIRQEVNGMPNQDLNKSVLVCIDLNTEVRCRKDAKCIQLKVFSQFENIGNPSAIEEVKSIW